jgi:hypothetical protein
VTSALPAHPARARLHASTALRAGGFGGLAVAWYALTTFVPVGVPIFAVAFVLALLVMLSVEPDARFPERGVTTSRRNLFLAFLAVLAFIPVAFGMDLLLGRIPIESAHAALATSAAVAVLLPRLAETRELQHPAALGHRELIISIAAIVAAARSYQSGDIWLAMFTFAVLAPIVMAVRMARSGVHPPRRLTHSTWALETLASWLFLALLGTAALSGTFYVWHVVAPDAYAIVIGAFWVGLAATAVLVAVPRPRFSVASNVLVALGSLLLLVQLVGAARGPTDAVTIGVPFTEEWQVASGGRSTLVNAHFSLGVQRDAIDFVQLVDGKTYDGDRSRLENFHIFGAPLLAVADGRVTAAVGSHPDEPVGGRTWHEMAGNHVILDIGDGHFVLYGHLEQDSLQVRVGDDVRRGQVIGRVGDSGNSDEPHLHIQVQNTPTFDVEDRDIRTYPIQFEGATLPDLRRGDSVRPVTG